MATLSKPARQGIILLIAFNILIELALSVGDWGLFGITRMRALMYEYAGFWPGLLKGWTYNYPIQPYLMFLTYGFLHAGLIHLALNMITLWSLGRAVIKRVGFGGFAALYAISILGGATGYALLAEGLQPMVGASGALFGLAGGLLAWLYVDRFPYHRGFLPVLQAVILLVLLNLAIWWAMSGQLAWETHLGGFLAGWIAALVIDPRPMEHPVTPPD